MDFIEAINDKFKVLGIYPEVEAFPISDLQDHVVLVDTQDTTVYHSHEGCYRWLALVDDDCEDPFEAVMQALHPNQTEIKAYMEENGEYRQDHEAMDLAEEDDPT